MATGTPEEVLPAEQSTADDDIRELMRAYDRALTLADALPRVVEVRTRVPRNRPHDALRRVWWPRWPAKTLLAWHVRRTLDKLHSVLSRRVVIGEGSPEEAAELETVAKYRDAMPEVRTKTYLAGVIVLTILTGRYLLGPAGPVLSDVPFLKEVGAYQRGFVEGAPAEKDLIAISDEARTLFESFGDSIGTDVSSLGKVADAFAGAALSDIALVLVGALLSLYVVTRPFFMPGYRLTRLLLNVADAPDALPSTTARWSVQHATGAYRRERAVFARFGERPPAERPLDLVIPLLWLSLPIALGVYLILNVDDVLFEQPAGYWLLGVPFEFAIAVGCGLLTLAALRVAWLWRTWRRRSRGAGTLYEVVLPGGAHATVRNSAGVAALVYLVPYYLPVWWAIVNTQLWQVEPADSRRSRWNAFMAFAAFLRLPRAFIIPPAVSLWHTRRRLHEVQRSAAITPRALWTTLKRLIPLAGAGYLLILAPIPNISLYLAPIPLRLPIVDDGPDSMLTLVAIGLLTSTSVLAFVAAYVQGRVNEVLLRRGEPVAEGPG